MGKVDTPEHGIYEGTVLDVDRHAGNEAPVGAVPKPKVGGLFELNDAVVAALPIPGSKVLSANEYGMSLWGQTGKILVELPDGVVETYFLKTANLGDTARAMMQGEYESLKAIHAVSPSIGPEPYAWGKYKDATTHFLLTEFREVGEQPPSPVKFTKRLAEMHRKSVSPTGKFGFHITTCHAQLQQITDCWEESWAVLYRKQLAHMIKLDEEKKGQWPEFKIVCQLVLNKVIPRLLVPLQSGGRSIKPCLVHGDLWDENSATDAATGEPFIFDAGSFYAHNEYEIGNWRAVRHRLSIPAYVKNYLREFPASEPEEEWDDRNLLYSLRYDLGCAILIPCNQREVVMENMTILCKKFFPNELATLQNSLIGQHAIGVNPALRRVVTYAEDQEVEEEEEEDGLGAGVEDEDEDEDSKTSNPYGLDIDDEWDDHLTLVDGDRQKPTLTST